MSLKSFNQTLFSAYALPDKETKLLKAAFIGLCSDVDRFFRMSFGVDIYSQVNEESFYSIKRPFPNFRKISLEQFNRLLFTFSCIRDVNAHLYLNKPIYIDEDIVEFINEIITPKYNLSSNKEITIYGAMCIVLLFSQNYQFWSFNTEVIRHNVFLEISKKSLPDFQKDFQLYHKKILGKCKPIFPDSYLFFTKLDVLFFIEEVKKTLTRLIFDFESNASKPHKMSRRAVSIKTLLSKYKCLKDKDELIYRIVELRNIWLHGYRLFDTVYTKDGTFVFDFDYLFDVLTSIKRAFVSPNITPIIKDINECGSKMIDFYTLRLIEISYKILDVSLLKEEKLSERISNSMRAYERCMVPEEWFYNNAKKLLVSDKIKWFLAPSKFEDDKTRTMENERLGVFVFNSPNGFDIGDMHCESTQMVLTNINCSIKNQLKINGKYLYEYKNETVSKYSFIDVYQINL